MRPNRGFTLIEVLLVVVLLSILAAVVVPQLTTASAAARISMLADDLRMARTQIQVFSAQHRGTPPGYPNLDRSQPPDAGTFEAHMTQASTATGATAAPGTPGFPYGPYMSRLPTNPLNDLATVQIILDGQAVPNAADDSHGWLFKPSELVFKSDCTGTGERGEAFITY